ncbi:MAG: hypothetical protein GEU86_15705 [Actinophytocola sp.]|nr:hypothetical protein [Actinophytocola sp.]
MLSEREALTALRREDPDRAEDAAAALGWLSGEHGLHTITRLRLAEFLWYSLPVKWSITTGDQVRVARTLGRLFSLTSMDGYAEMCASPLPCSYARRELRSVHESRVVPTEAGNDVSAG